MSDRPDFSDVETRRASNSSRRMTAGRRFVYAIGKPLLRFILFALTSTYRFQKVIGQETADRIVADKGRAYVPVLWHGHQLAGLYLIRSWARRGFKPGFVISASVDGEVPADIARSWGAEVVRGSAKQSAGLALRDAVSVMKRGVSLVTMSDGPRGPKHEVKTGTVMMARMGNAPIVPIGCAAKPAWTMNTWDGFMIPLPFARVAMAVGEPIEVPRSISGEQIEATRQQLQTSMEDLVRKAEQQLS